MFIKNTMYFTLFALLLFALLFAFIDTYYVPKEKDVEKEMEHLQESDTLQTRPLTDLEKQKAKAFNAYNEFVTYTIDRDFLGVMNSDIPNEEKTLALQALLQDSIAYGGTIKDHEIQVIHLHTITMIKNQITSLNMEQVMDDYDTLTMELYLFLSTYRIGAQK